MHKPINLTKNENTQKPYNWLKKLFSLPKKKKTFWAACWSLLEASIAGNLYNWQEVTDAYELATRTYLLNENPLMASLSLNNLGDVYNI